MICKINIIGTIPDLPTLLTFNMVHGKNNFNPGQYRKGTVEYIAEKLAEKMFCLSYDAMGPDGYSSSWPLEDSHEMSQYMGMGFLYDTLITPLSEEERTLVFERARDRFDEQP